MNKEYLDEYTTDWKKLRGDETLSVWGFFDTTEQQIKYAIKKNGEVKITFYKDEISPYTLYEMIRSCL